MNPTASQRLPDWDSCQNQLREWSSLALKRRQEHEDSVAFRQFWGTLLGIPTTMLSTVVGTAVFTTLQKQDAQLSNPAKAWLAGLSIAAALLSGLQAFFRFSERAARHQLLANQSHAICTEIEFLLVCPPKPEDVREVMMRLKDQIAALGAEASASKLLPSVSAWLSKFLSTKRGRLRESDQSECSAELKK